MPTPYQYAILHLTGGAYRIARMAYDLLCATSPQASTFDEFDRTLVVTIIPLLLLVFLGLCTVVISRTDVLLLIPVKGAPASNAATAVEPHLASGAARRRSLVPVAEPQLLTPEQRLQELRLEWRGRLISAALTLAFIVYPGASSQIVRAFR